MSASPSKPDISVVIAAHNVEAYIDHAVQSALEQKNVTVEVIVVDDASTDNTTSVASSITDERLNIIHLHKNSGPSVARNVGIAAATSPWITILDGDDTFLPGRLERCLKIAHMTSADIVVDNIKVFREYDQAEYPMFKPKMFAHIGLLTLDKFIAGNRSFLGDQTTLGYLKPIISTTFLRAHNITYDPDLRVGEDYVLMCELLANGAQCVLDATVGYRYTSRSSSISHRLTSKDVERITSADKKWVKKYSLNDTTLQAQNLREHGIKIALAYTRLVEAIKSRNVNKILSALGKHPSAAIHLWRPIWVRIKRIISFLS